MKRLKIALTCALAAVLVSATTTFAGSGVGGTFNLGQANTVNASSILSGTPTTAIGMLDVRNASALAGSFGVVGRLVSSSSSPKSAAVRAFGAGAGAGVSATATNGIGVSGSHTATTGISPGVRGDTASTDPGAFGVYGLVSSASPGNSSAAVRGENKGTNNNGSGVWGSHAGGGTGVFGSSANGTGVKGVHAASTGAAPAIEGVTASAAPFAYAISGLVSSSSAAGFGSAAVYGQTNTGDVGYGVLGKKNGSGYGVAGYAPGGAGVLGSGGYGVTGYGQGVESIGVRGQADWHGVDGYSSSGFGVFGASYSGSGAHGVSETGYGVHGKSTSNDGVLGESSSGSGVVGVSNNSVGVYGYSTNGSAGYFEGSVTVSGDFYAGAKHFRIDDPLDPAHRYLQHTSVESSEMMDLYTGNVTTDARGFATVEMPRWFQALNRSFRYQLTVLGRSFAQAIVWREIHGNRFTIRTNQANVRVSWLVTGIRHDPFANAHRTPVIVPKAAPDRGKYLSPELYDKSPRSAIGYERRGSLVRQRDLLVR